MKQFVGQVKTRTVPFMDGEVDIKVLTVGDIRSIEAKTKELSEKDGEADQLEVLRFVLRLAVVGAEDMSDEDFDTFPVTELTALSEAIVGTTPSAGNE